MDMPALHKYGQMPRLVPQAVEAIAVDLPPNSRPLAPHHAMWIAMSSEPRGSLRLVLGISVAVALTSLLFVAGGTFFARLLEGGGATFVFVASTFVASVIAGYFVSGLTIRSAIVGWR